ncbi:MAG: extracellular solute-binding protein [Erysipelotrichaceae bacterium]|nr:extracellular solute-binding protein [Erysipelotrichaceae bacterium]
MKKFLTILLSVLLACTLFGCAGNKGGNESSDVKEFDVTIWFSEIEGVADQVQAQVDKFNEANPDIKINATIRGITEAESATQVINDVESAPDIYCFAQDQLARLVQAGALNVLGEGAAKQVTEMNDAGSVGAATFNGTLYCYPLTADNGYFMYYDKSVITDDVDIDSLEAILEACEKANKYFSFEYKTSAWYLASMFFATGCKSDWVLDDAGTIIGVNDTFNSPEGLIAMKGLEKIAKSTARNSSSDNASFSTGSAVLISGTWARPDVTKDLGENMGVADLPSFTVDGQTYHMGSFSGNKLLGVKPQQDAEKASACQRLALWLTGEECQAERFASFGWGPSNKNVQASDAVQQDEVLAAFFAQSAYAVPQNQIAGSWWDIAKVLGQVAEDATSEADLQKGLDDYTAAINGIFAMDPAIANAYTVIGSFAGHAWDYDEAMTEENGVWTSAAIEFAAGDEFKVRKGLSWDEAFPADNFVVETAGTYKVQLDSASGEVSLVQ